MFQNNQINQQQRPCSQCGQVIQLNDQFIVHEDPNSGAQLLRHLRCPNLIIQTGQHQAQIPMIPKNLAPQLSQMIQFSPDMLVFDFQLLHPMSLTTVFSLQNQPANFFIDRAKQLITFNKLLCSSTSVPFNMAIVSLKWDFFRDPQTIIDSFNPMDPSYQMRIQNLPQKPVGQNQIQGQINFLDMLQLNDRNVTITLQERDQE